MNAFENARRQVETERGWKINAGSIVMVDDATTTWMAKASTTHLAAHDLPEREFAIHVVGTTVSDIHADSIANLQVQLVQRAAGRARALSYDGRNEHFPDIKLPMPAPVDETAFIDAFTGTVGSEALRYMR